MSSIRSLLLLALAATPSLATRICGTSKPGQKLVETHARHAHKSALARVSGKPADIRSEPFSATIDTWMHVIGIDGVNDESSENYVSASTLSKQIDVLNVAYATAGFTFNFIDYDRSSNSSWDEIPDGSSQERDIKTALRNKGSYADLNLYFGNLSGGLLGYAKFPQGDPDKDTYLLDGVVCGADTLPGNSGDFGLGLTAVHEVGHWLGLFHTFESHDEEDGCTGFGDLVFDTPAEASSASGCDVGRDTCKGKQAYGGISGIPGSMEGPDPVHNYMDYSDDACITEFTPGQIERMHELWTSLRFAPPAAPAPSNGTVTPNVTTVDRHDHPRRVARLF